MGKFDSRPIFSAFAGLAFIQGALTLIGLGLGAELRPAASAWLAFNCIVFAIAWFAQEPTS